jgi:predicted amidohydrolase
VAGTIPVSENGSDKVYNESFLFSPNGGVGVQGKLHMTRFEHEDWKVSPRSQLRVFETKFGELCIAIC